MVNPGLILAIALALVHVFASRLPIFSLVLRFRWTSFAAGVSLSYVFLEIFPELSHTQEELYEVKHSQLAFSPNVKIFLLLLEGQYK